MSSFPVGPRQATAEVTAVPLPERDRVIMTMASDAEIEFQASAITSTLLGKKVTPGTTTQFIVFPGNTRFVTETPSDTTYRLSLHPDGEHILAMPRVKEADQQVIAVVGLEMLKEQEELQQMATPTTPVPATPTDPTTTPKLNPYQEQAEQRAEKAKDAIGPEEGEYEVTVPEHPEQDYPPTPPVGEFCTPSPASGQRGTICFSPCHAKRKVQTPFSSPVPADVQDDRKRRKVASVDAADGSGADECDDGSGEDSVATPRSSARLNLCTMSPVPACDIPGCTRPGTEREDFLIEEYGLMWFCTVCDVGIDPQLVCNLAAVKYAHRLDCKSEPETP